MKIHVIVKSTFRILLRSKAFLFFTIVVPFISLGILNLKGFAGREEKVNANSLYELKTINQKISYIQDPYKLSVRVLDQSASEVGKAFANELVTTGIFQIFYSDVSTVPTDQINETIQSVGKNDKIGGLIWLKNSLVSDLREKNATHGIVFYDSKADERTEILYDTVKKLAGQYELLAGTITSEDGWIKYQEQNLIGNLKRDVLLAKVDGTLTEEQSSQVQKIAFVYAVLTISFLFTGVMISDTVVKEKENKVFSRICLSDITTLQYMIGKLIVTLLCVLLQTAVLSIGTFVLLKQTYAIGTGPLIFSIFILGIIFSTMSLSIGILLNNTMNSNYMAFFLWVISAQLSGCYFDLSDGGDLLTALSKLTPQKWALTFVREIIGHTGTPYVIIMTSAFAFLCISGAFGAIACKRTVIE